MNNYSLLQRTHQRGVVMLLCLIVLVILLIGGVAVVRSTSSTLISSGNLAFRRDLVNQGEQAIVRVLADFQNPASLGGTGMLGSHHPDKNYSAVQLAMPADKSSGGIPEVMLSNTKSGRDVAGATFVPTGPNISGATSDVQISYVVDRLCNVTGPATKSNCVYASDSEVLGGSSSSMPAGGRLPPVFSPVYRVSVRVTGPRDTQVFLQSSFSKPE